MNDIYITLTGNVAAPPRQHAFADGSRVTSLRVATRHRFFDRKTQEWSDGDTVFFAVRCWRTLGDNVAQSFQVGHPVVVCGKLRIREFGPDGDRRFMPEIEASSIGHDLRWGVGAFSKPERSGGIGTLSRETRESLDESTQDWAMSGSANVHPLHGRPSPASPPSASSLSSPFSASTASTASSASSALSAEEAAQETTGWPFPVSSADLPAVPASEAGTEAASVSAVPAASATTSSSGDTIILVPPGSSEDEYRTRSEELPHDLSEKQGREADRSAPSKGKNTDQDVPSEGGDAGPDAPAEGGDAGSGAPSGGGDTGSGTPSEGGDADAGGAFRGRDEDRGAGHPGGGPGKVRILNTEDAARVTTPRSRRAKAA
ncbi:single-stranded DNA-binding protein [Nonomuraea mangrovi]|uniref:Single-stranded DNA-binding protein n=1 Tax=Nonomuraea mangrovi TaxID=2316207 RepID=A0ABW4SUG8_9ACTN